MPINNQAQFIGHVGNDPEIKILPSGQKVASFSLATKEVYKDKTGEKKTITDWHNINAFGAQAETIEKYVKKGSELAVVGKHKTNNYENKDKIKVSRSYFVISELRFLGRPKDETGNASNLAEEAEATIKDEDDDLPF